MLNRRNFFKTLGISAFLPAAMNVSAGKEASPAAVTKTLRLVQWCDPQLGFGQDLHGPIFENFNKAIDKINELKPDAVAVAGDLMHRVSDPADDVVNGFKRIESQVIIAPGNHDIPEPVTPEKLTVFRSNYGPDRSSILVNGWKIIAINTQLWRGAEPEETAAQDKWIADELAAAKEEGIPSILLSHIPPFYAHPGEGDDGGMIPNADGVRMTLLERAVESGTRFWLSGHTHQTQMKVFEGMVLLNGETTSINFDKRPFGFRLLTAEPNGDYTWDFVRV